MKYQTSAAFRRALESRLQTLAGISDQQTMRLRKNVVFQRLLARLLTISADQWILKGGLALDFRLSSRDDARSRATRDMDLARRGALEAADLDFRRTQGMPLDDYFEFDIRRTDLAPEKKGNGAAQIRYHVRASLAGRLFEEVVVDVGAALPSAMPDVVEGPDLLAFADLPPVRVPTLSIAVHVAEKLHAYTRRYGNDSAPSSRPKDLIDIVLLAKYERFIAGELWSAIESTFDFRQTHPIPSEVPPPPGVWTKTYRDLAERVDISPELDDGHRAASAFLDPILRRSVQDGMSWDAFSQRWFDR